MTDQKNAGSCCSADGFCHSAAPDAQGSGVTTVYMVSGMTCGHCEGAVSQEISALDGVTTVKAVAETGEVIVTSAAPLDEEAVRAAVDEADFGKHPGAGARAESWKAGNDLGVRVLIKSLRRSFGEFVRAGAGRLQSPQQGRRLQSHRLFDQRELVHLRGAEGGMEPLGFGLVAAFATGRAIGEHSPPRSGWVVVGKAGEVLAQVGAELVAGLCSVPDGVRVGQAIGLARIATDSSRKLSQQDRSAPLITAPGTVPVCRPSASDTPWVVTAQGWCADGGSSQGAGRTYIPWRSSAYVSMVCAKRAVAGGCRCRPSEEQEV